MQFFNMSKKRTKQTAENETIFCVFMDICSFCVDSTIFIDLLHLLKGKSGELVCFEAVFWGFLLKLTLN